MNCDRVLQMNELLASFRKIRLAVIENHLLCSADMQAGHKTQSSRHSDLNDMTDAS